MKQLEPVLKATGRNGDGRRYTAIAAQVVSLIDKGAIGVGQKVPSVREMSRTLKVAPGTVIQAYRMLEDHGRIRSRPQSGFYVLPIPLSVPEPEPVSTQSRAARPTVAELVLRVSEMSALDDFVPMGCALPARDQLPLARLSRIAAAIGRRTNLGLARYDKPPGLKELRLQIVRHYLKRGCTLSPAEIVTTSGCQEAVGLCLRAVARPGAVIVVDSPCYYGSLQVLETQGLRALEVRTNPRTGVDLDELAKTLKKTKVAACLFTTNCHNPLGFIMPDAAKRKLVRMLALQKIPLIEDDTYGDLAFGDERPSVCKTFDENGLVMLCSSFSKTLAPGARVGWCAPGAQFDLVKHLKFSNNIATAITPQAMVAEYLESGSYSHHLRRLTRLYQEQVQQMSLAIERHFPDGTRISRPAGGHLLWVELPPKVKSRELFEAAAANKIIIVPGILFSPCGRYRNFIRINCSHAADARMEKALATLGWLARRALEG